MIDGNVALPPSGTPAIAFNGSTMVPVALLKKAGVGVNWDASSQTVKITSPQPVIKEVTKTQVVEKGVDFQKLYKTLSSYGVTDITTHYSGKISSTTVYYNGSSTKISSNDLTAIVSEGRNVDSYWFEIGFTSDDYYSFLTSDINNWYEGKLTNQQLLDSVEYTPAPTSPDAPATSTTYNQADCDSINSYYNGLIDDIPSAHSGLYTAEVNKINTQRTNELKAYGCPAS
jgi:hypothetical protein